MAYAAAVTYDRVTLAGRKHHIVTIVETGITATTDEWSVDMAKLGTLHLHKCVLTAGDGTATTIDPIVQEASGTATVNNVLTNGAAAVSTRNTALGAHFYVATGVLYGRSVANGTTGTTGYVTTTLIIEAAITT